MGTHPNITAAKFPKQGRNLHRRCTVIFDYDASVSIGGVVVRDDTEEPFQTIIELDDGRYIRGSECQYSPHD